VEFDESRIADAIYKAALSVGGEDRFLAEELASVVTLFLEKTYAEEVPTIEDVQDMVEKVLIETGHAQTAKAYILYRERRTKLREAEVRARQPVQRTLFEPGPLTVLDPTEERSAPFHREGLAHSLTAEADLPPEVAGEVAAAVEDRVHSLAEPTLSSSLLSRLVDAELLSRGLERAVRRRGAVDLARRRIEASLFPKEPERGGTPAGRVAGSVLRYYALTEVHETEVAAAHLAGRIDLSGITSPGAIYTGSLSTDAIRGSGIPGLKARFRPSAVGDPRRFAAWLGRAVRAISPHVTHGLTLSHLNILTAPLLTGLDFDAMREEAWHLLCELAGIPGLEIELALAPPPILSARKARGPDGEPLEETYARFAGTALQLARAFLDVRGTAEGLGPRSELPRLTLTLGPDALSQASVRAVVTRALTEAMDREPVLFVLDREDLPLLGTPKCRVRLEDATRLTDTATLSVAVAAQAVVNLPRAAYRAKRGGEEGYYGEVEAAVELALSGIRARRRFLARAGAASDGPLAPLTRPRGESAPLLDLGRATNSLGVLGLNEAVSFLMGEELHESDEALKLGQKTLSLVRLKCEEARKEGLSVGVDAVDDEGLLVRLADKDRQAHLEISDWIPARYTPGVALREDAPVDLAVRLEREGRLGLSLRTATVRWHLFEGEHPAPETVIAFLEKTWGNTRVSQLRLGRRGPPS
ncbi:MAG: anaerobic ribonucleoside-triphosphate reductase, partial [Planctomycetota bacterium]